MVAVVKDVPTKVSAVPWTNFFTPPKTAIAASLLARSRGKKTWVFLLSIGLFYRLPTGFLTGQNQPALSTQCQHMNTPMPPTMVISRFLPTRPMAAVNTPPIR